MRLGLVVFIAPESHFYCAKTGLASLCNVFGSTYYEVGLQFRLRAMVFRSPTFGRCALGGPFLVGGRVLGTPTPWNYELRSQVTAHELAMIIVFEFQIIFVGFAQFQLNFGRC